MSTQLVIDRLRKDLYRVAGIRLFMFAAQDIRAGGRQSDSNYQYTLTSTDLDLLQKWAPIVGKRMESVEGITDVSSDRDPGGLQLTLAIDRQDRLQSRRSRPGHRQCAQQRVLAAADFDHLHPAQPVHGGAGDRSEIPGRSIQPRSYLRRRRQWRAGAALGRGAHVARIVPARGLSFAVVSLDHGLVQHCCPACRWRSPPRTSSARSTNCTCPRASGAVSTAMPATSTRTSGQQPLLILGALVAMYIVLGVLYESLAHPLTIISTLPSAGLGALLALQVTNTPLTVIAFVGIILLIGIVKKNGIMMVDFALDAERQRGLSLGRRHFRGLQRPVPPDPDDDAGGPVRGHSAGHRHRPRHRTAPAARHHHHRRPVRVADPDAVHDAGDLSPDRPDAAAAIRAGRDRGACGIAPGQPFALLKRPPGKRIAGACPNRPSPKPAPPSRRKYRSVRTASSPCRCASATASSRSRTRCSS